MLDGLLKLARGLRLQWRRAQNKHRPRGRRLVVPAAAEVGAREPDYLPLAELVLTDGVSRTLFRQYEEHRREARGREETGWVLLGHRLENRAIALAALPAGAEREAGVAHVRFNTLAQAVASRILRQEDRQLGILGVVHTHPGSLRHPSDGDFEGDSAWVRLLPGQEGVFGIGTADGRLWLDGETEDYGIQPAAGCQCYRGLRFDWYALASGEADYRSLPVRLTNGPDRAEPLQTVWPTVEQHAAGLDRLARVLKGVRFEVTPEGTLEACVALDRNGDQARVALKGQKARYLLIRGEDCMASEDAEANVDRGFLEVLLQWVSDSDKADSPHEVSQSVPSCQR
jgi:proteasome lid subunit RPN8/RPN11